MHNTQQLSALTTIPNHNMLLRISLAHISNLCVASCKHTPPAVILLAAVATVPAPCATPQETMTVSQASPEPAWAR